jgi:hypothetical protein
MVLNIVCSGTKKNRAFYGLIVANPLTVSFIEKALLARGVLTICLTHAHVIANPEFRRFWLVGEQLAIGFWYRDAGVG